jgi:tripartite-type tricarboxylate transporter receptor subunit TctC
MTRVCLRFAAACLLLAAGMAQAQYPGKPIHLIIPFPPGGPTDIIGRAVGQKLSEALGQPVIVENRGGAGASIGSDFVAKSAPDGYTLLVGTTGSHTINPAIYSKLPYDPVRDFAPVTLLATYGNVLVVSPNLPVKNVKQLIELARAKPGEITFGSAGNGSSNHLSGELLASMSGVRMQHVPYKGSAPALVDVMAGQTSFMFDILSTSLPQIKAGKVRAIAYSGPTRSPLIPDVPTVAESGVPGYDVVGWFGLFAPAGTPRDIVNRLNAETVKILKLPEMKEKLTGYDPAPSTPEQFAAIIKSDITTWAKVVKDSGAHVD